MNDTAWVRAHLHTHTAFQIRVATGLMSAKTKGQQVQAAVAPQFSRMYRDPQHRETGLVTLEGSSSRNDQAYKSALTSTGNSPENTLHASLLVVDESPLSHNEQLAPSTSATRPMPAAERCPPLGEQRATHQPTQRPLSQIWNIVKCAEDPEQYTALNSNELRADPVLRLALRDPAVEDGAGVILPSGVRVCMNARERTVMRETLEGATTARRATGEALAVAVDLHARHHFTSAAAVDEVDGPKPAKCPPQATGGGIGNNVDEVGDGP